MASRAPGQLRGIIRDRPGLRTGLGWSADLLAGRGAGGIALAYVVASVVGGGAAASAGMAAGREVVVALERAAVGLLGRLDERVLRQRGTARPQSAAGTRQDREESA